MCIRLANRSPERSMVFAPHFCWHLPTKKTTNSKPRMSFWILFSSCLPSGNLLQFVNLKMAHRNSWFTLIYRTERWWFASSQTVTVYQRVGLSPQDQRKNAVRVPFRHLFQPSNLPQESNTVKFPGLTSNLDSIIQDYTGWGPQDS